MIQFDIWSLYLVKEKQEQKKCAQRLFSYSEVCIYLQE